MNSQSKVIFWLTFSIIMIVLFGLFPLQQSDLITELLSLAARSFFAWVGGKLAVSYFEDSQSGG